MTSLSGSVFVKFSKMFEDNKNEYYCINCGEKTKSLYKKYSETVLKLTECENCKEIADKYVEYDIVIIIIDLVLLNPMAYRHILLNTKFKHYWKMSVILILLESYCNWTLTSRNVDNLCNKLNKTEQSLNDFDMNVEDLKFYVICVNIALSYLCFVSVIYVLTLIYQRYLAESRMEQHPFTLILKTVTLASTGIFLQLPSIIWDISLYGYHLHFITLYTCLSQLLAYRVICQSPKVWCLFVIFSSHFLKISISTYLTTVLDVIFIK